MIEQGDRATGGKPEAPLDEAGAEVPEHRQQGKAGTFKYCQFKQGCQQPGDDDGAEKAAHCLGGAQQRAVIRELAVIVQRPVPAWSQCQTKQGRRTIGDYKQKYQVTDQPEYGLC